MNPATFQKQPWEKRQLGIDFTPSLVSGDSLASINSIVITDSNGVDCSATMITGTPYINGNKVYVWIQGGSHNGEYKLDFRMISANGEDIEDTLTIIVKDKRLLQ